jgi:hypothetical protein
MGFNALSWIGIVAERKEADLVQADSQFEVYIFVMTHSTCIAFNEPKRGTLFPYDPPAWKYQPV